MQDYDATIFLYRDDFLLCAELADPNADLGEIEQMVWHSKGLESAEEKDNTMSKSLVDSVLHDEETLGDELPDGILEVAGSKGWEQAGNSFTLAFCTGLDTCPSMRN